MGKANSSGLMAATTSATSLKIILRVLVLTLGATSVSTLVTGRTIRWKEPAHLHGPMVAATMVITLMTKKKAMAFSTGPTVASTMVNGSMESKMVLVLTHPPPAKQRRVNGAMESVSTGSPTNECVDKVQLIP